MFTFSTPTIFGPWVRRFDTLHDLAVYLAGYTRRTGEVIQAFSMTDWRGA